MRASELRLGNYINLEDKGIYEVSSGFDIDKLMGWDGTDYATGVPLTLAWLEFFGLTKRMNHYEKGYALWISLDGVVKGEPSVWIHGKYCPAIKVMYVHQLQNLYFALTGQDFTTAPQLTDLLRQPQESKP